MRRFLENQVADKYIKKIEDLIDQFIEKSDGDRVFRIYVKSKLPNKKIIKERYLNSYIYQYEINQRAKKPTYLVGSD